MTGTHSPDDDVQLRKCLGRVLVSVVVLSGVSIVVGYSGWVVLPLTAKTRVYKPETTDDDTLRHRLRATKTTTRPVRESA